ncbi:MAG: PP2C family protein-serine/threonine phosphatase [Sporichthyaceae bacterium]
MGTELAGTGAAPPEFVSDPRLERVVRLARRASGCPIASITVLAQGTVWMPFQVGYDLPAGPHVVANTSTFTAATLARGELLVVPDTATDPRFAADPLRFGRHIRFCAGIPLHLRNDPGDPPDAVLAVLDTAARLPAPEQLQALVDLGAWLSEELARDREIRQVQTVTAGFDPPDALDIPGYQVGGITIPARDAGGDIFDHGLMKGPDGPEIHLGIADVSGRGAAAALLAVSVRAALRCVRRRGDPLHEYVRKVDLELREDLAAAAATVDLLVGRLTMATGELEYVAAGHGLSVVFRAAGSSRLLPSDGPPLGAAPGAAPWRTQALHLAPGEAVLSGTTGVMEMFDDIPAAMASAAARLAAQRDLAGYLSDLRAVMATRTFRDDVTLLGVRRNDR